MSDVTCGDVGTIINAFLDFINNLANTNIKDKWEIVRRKRKGERKKGREGIRGKYNNQRDSVGMRERIM